MLGAGGEGDRARQSRQRVNIWKGEQTGISNRVVRVGVTEKVTSERRLEARGFAYRQQYSSQKKQPCKGPMGKLCGMFMEKPRGVSVAGGESSRKTVAAEEIREE